LRPRATATNGARARADNRDALLGLAAIDVRNGQLNIAEVHYLKLLEMDPRDSHAAGEPHRAARPARPGGFGEPPENPHREVTGGRATAFLPRQTSTRSSRAGPKPGGYFKAYSVDSENADYAFNLAVSLISCARENWRGVLPASTRFWCQRAATSNPAQARSAYRS